MTATFDHIAALRLDARTTWMVAKDAFETGEPAKVAMGEALRVGMMPDLREIDEYNARVYCSRRAASWGAWIVDHRAPNDYLCESVLRAITPKAAHDLLKAFKPSEGRCYGGWIRHFSTEYPCSGCASCRPLRDEDGNPAIPYVVYGQERRAIPRRSQRLGRPLEIITDERGNQSAVGYLPAVIGEAIGRAIWRAGVWLEHADLAAGLAGFHALASIGAAIEAALAPGRAIATMFAACADEYNAIAKGRWYKVTGKRGKAKASYGVEGVCIWIGESMGGPGGRGYFGRGGIYKGTDRVGLKDANGNTHWVAASCITRIHTPAAAQALAANEAAKRATDVAAKQARAAIVVGKGDVIKLVHALDNRDRKQLGVEGEVFWTGPGRDGGTRVGYRPFDDHQGNVLWADTRDIELVRKATPKQPKQRRARAPRGYNNRHED